MRSHELGNWDREFILFLFLWENGDLKSLDPTPPRSGLGRVFLDLSVWECLGGLGHRMRIRSAFFDPLLSLGSGTPIWDAYLAMLMSQVLGLGLLEFYG